MKKGSKAKAGYTLEEALEMFRQWCGSVKTLEAQAASQGPLQGGFRSLQERSNHFNRIIRKQKNAELKSICNRFSRLARENAVDVGFLVAQLKQVRYEYQLQVLRDERNHLSLLILQLMRQTGTARTSTDRMVEILATA